MQMADISYTVMLQLYKVSKAPEDIVIQEAWLSLDREQMALIYESLHELYLDEVFKASTSL